VRLDELVAYLDAWLRVREVPDDPEAMNGLQVENGGTVTSVAVAVDACEAVITASAARGADLLIVHHGLFWGPRVPVTGRAYRKLRALVGSGLALYSAHLPLDVHPDVGNNTVLAGLLGVQVTDRWGEYKGAPIGVAGPLSVERDEIGRRLQEHLGVAARLIPGGPVRTTRVGVITGAGGSMIRQAHAAGIDTFVTGEGAHHTYFDAEELGVNVFFAGHYATETVGVKALGEHLGERFGLPWSFIDHPTGL
jgi:dinuclear metal center YbgI/SA1388 family protein